jgi:glycosyltransferase involved in cell wall biosynthesis
MKILFSSYGYDNDDVSESLSAYDLSKAIDKYHDITILTKDKTFGHNIINVNCTPFLQSSEYYRALKLDYFEFVLKSYFIARKMIHNYHIIHHISPISIRYPNPLCNLNKPFIWGPIGGSIPYPKGFREIEKQDSLITKLRKIDRFRLSFDPFMINILKNSARIVVNCKAVLKNIPRKYRNKIIIIPEGIVVNNRGRREEETGNYVFSSGRLVPYKAIDLLIKAFALSKKPNNMNLLITGDGPERIRLAKLIGELGLYHKIKLLGKVSRDENIRLMKGSIFCVFPAINEAFGIVNLEAMAVRKAIIVTDHGGPADIVVDGVTGFKIKAGSAEEYIFKLKERMDLLFNNKILRKTMEHNALRRVTKKFSWNNIGKQYENLYQEVLNEIHEIKA